MAFTSGVYVGNAADDTAITGVGFQPNVVIIHGYSNSFALWRQTGMAATKPIDSTIAASYADGIKSLDVDGFTIGTNIYVNAVGVSFYWMAFMDDGAADCEVKYGSYMGDGADNRDISGVTTPVWVFVGTLDQAKRPRHRIKNLNPVSDTSWPWDDPAAASNCIQKLGGDNPAQADGFEIGSHTDVNKSGDTYHWFAFQAKTNVLVENTYDGNGVDNRSIAGVGFAPEMVWVHEIGGGKSWWFTDSHPADLTLGGQVGWGIADAIQALEADGFQVGTYNEVNQNLYTFRYLAFGVGAVDYPIALAGALSAGWAAGTLSAAYVLRRQIAERIRRFFN